MILLKVNRTHFRTEKSILVDLELKMPMKRRQTIKLWDFVLGSALPLTSGAASSLCGGRC
jgi:hypothetical protein